MKQLDIAIGFIMAIEKGDLTQAASLLGEDMLFCGPVRHPLTRSELIQFLSALRRGVPDWRSHFRGVEIDLPFVRMTIEVTGRHLRPLSGLLPGMPTYPPTGLAFHLPPEGMIFLIENNSIHRIHLEPVQGGWIDGMLEQLGLTAPVMN
jgi:hypothetical protein